MVGLQHPDASNEDWLAFRPDVILKANGAPKQVNIIMSDGPEGRSSYAMGLFYDQMVIWYNGTQEVIQPQTILRACPLENHNIDRFDLIVGQYDENVLNRGVDLTRMTSLTIDSFYDLMVGDAEKACFELDNQRYLSP